MGFGWDCPGDGLADNSGIDGLGIHRLQVTARALAYISMVRWRCEGEGGQTARGGSPVMGRGLRLLSAGQ